MAGLNTTTSTNMSLRPTNPNPIVQTDIPAGPWPYNPKHEVPCLDEVDWASDEPLSLYSRRADRPGNVFLNRTRQASFLPPIFIPNSPLDEIATLAVSPGKNHSTTRRANPGGSPIPPPSAVLRCLPDFGRCFSHLCGHPSRAEDHYLLGAADDEDLDTGAHCHKCDKGTAGLRRGMHELPCGHTICPTHLNAAATRAVETARTSHPPQIRENLLSASRELARLRRDLVPRETAPQFRASQEKRILYWRRQLLSVLGLGCGVCGHDMWVVEDWISCLDEWVARQLWAVCWRLFEGADAPAVACGWADCGAAIPAWCSYRGGLGEQVFYCVACEGNSVWLESKGVYPTR